MSHAEDDLRLHQGGKELVPAEMTASIDNPGTTLVEELQQHSQNDAYLNEGNYQIDTYALTPEEQKPLE